MKINNLKINSYGNLKDKEMNFKKFNIIYGKNESGKSTLLNFIISIFYGISKNKNGKNFSDYDKFTPWNGEDFSGKIFYELENNNKYSVFRDFNKKNPEIYDENDINVSSEFNIDKKIGNQFFYDQTKINKEILNSTVISQQTEVEIDNTMKNQLLQKIANLSESGEEEVSYKKAINKLEKMLLTQVGTYKSQDRPINIAKNNIQIYQNKLDEINKYKEYRYEIEEKSKKINKELNEENNNKIIYEKIKELLNKNKLENEKINIKNKILEENNKKIEKNLLEKNKLEKNKNKKRNTIILFILIIINIFNLILIKNKIINILIFSLIPILITYILLNNKKNNSKIINEQIKILNKNNEELNEEIKKLKANLIEENKNEKEELIKKYGNNINDLFNSSIDIIIKDNRETIENLNLELYKLELDKKNIEPLLEELSKTTELLEIEKENLEKLEEQSDIYMMTKELLEDAYDEMKQNITPKFNKNLSENIKRFSNEKYKNLSINDEITVELENGKYESIEKLSTGTIQQIYLALRLSVIDEISEEKLPIILDEAFAYYDDDRLKETLEFLYNIDNQVIILTCTDREKNILNENKKEFNFIEL